MASGAVIYGYGPAWCISYHGTAAALWEIMHEEPDPLIEEWNQLSVDFEDTLEIDFPDDDDDDLELVADGEL
jgi:hypothetical protein